MQPIPVLNLAFSPLSKKILLPATAVSAALSLGEVQIPSSAQSFQSGGISANPAKITHVKNVLLLSPNPAVKAKDFVKALKKNNLKVVHIIVSPDKSLKTLVVKVTKGTEVSALPKAMTEPAFQNVQLNYKAKVQFVSTTPNDPFFKSGFSAHLGQLNVPEAWAAKASGAGITIASLDTGVDYQGNEDLQGKCPDQGINLLDRQKPGAETDSSGFGHGTFTANCAAGSTDNKFGQASPAYESTILPVVVTDSQGYAASSTIISAINYLLNKKVKLAILSINANPPYAFSDPGPVQSQVKQWGAEFYKKGGLIFTAAGNGDSSGQGVLDARGQTNVDGVPAFIVVGSVDSESRPSTFSNYGNQLMFTAPGEDIADTAAGGQAVRASGTSMAAALTAGVAAQIWGSNPGLTNAQVLSIMQRTATKPPGYSYEHFGHGIPNAKAAVSLTSTSF
ncbi:MAG TPA: S8 family serine peptidase [Chroococcales cyanobacterium]